MKPATSRVSLDRSWCDSRVKVDEDEMTKALERAIERWRGRRPTRALSEEDKDATSEWRGKWA